MWNGWVEWLGWMVGLNGCVEWLCEWLGGMAVWNGCVEWLCWMAVLNGWVEWLGFSPWNGEWFLSFWRCHRPRKRATLALWCGRFKPRLEIWNATAITTGAKHWHRQKDVFYVFVFVGEQRGNFRGRTERSPWALGGGIWGIRGKSLSLQYQ